MRTIQICTRRRSVCDILVGCPLSQTGRLVRRRAAARRALVVSDTTVFPLYGRAVVRSLADAGVEVFAAKIRPGERSKTLAAAEEICGICSRRGLERTDIIVAVGGGVVSDLAGFVASIYLRGIAFAAVPTTLLAQVDAAIGGKTAVDLPWAKNVIGSFHQPRLVVVDPAALSTLPARQMRQGLAEVVKYGMIGDARLCARLERTDVLRHRSWLSGVVAACVRMKADIVARDEMELSGEREVLNFGHTLGHAIEIACLPRYTHGEAVALGMAGETWLAVRRGRCAPDVLERLVGLLRRLKLPWDISEIDLNAAAAHLKYDKKVRKGRLRFVLPEAVGRVRVGEEMDRNEAVRILREWPYERERRTCRAPKGDRPS